MQSIFAAVSSLLFSKKYRIDVLAEWLTDPEMVMLTTPRSLVKGNTSKTVMAVSDREISIYRRVMQYR